MLKTGNSESIERRDFIRRASIGVVAAGLFPVAADAETSNISFNTANLVARVTHYHYLLANWMSQHELTIKVTDAAAWRAICKEIAETGFKAVEIWEAHASPETLDEARAKEWKSILDQAGLRPVAYAGRLNRETVQVCRWLEIPHIDGGLGDLTPGEATALCRESGIHFNFENHPEKSSEEILKKIGGGNEWLGVCIDTGWLGTQGVSAPDVIRACGELVRHTHIKDVNQAGKHETCQLGEGVVNLPECLSVLRSLKYRGWYSWEDEPEDRNPFDSARRNLEWIAQHA